MSSNNRKSLRTLLSFVSLFNSDAFISQKPIPSHSTKKTSIHVSELHVPGYRETKIPFIYSDDEDIPKNSIYNNAQHIKRNVLKEIEYSNDDYTSIIPYQSGYLLHKTNKAIFSEEECRSIINEAEEICSMMGWTTNRHGNYPTTDIPIIELPNTLSFLKKALVERIYPLLRHQFKDYLPDGYKLRVADGFVVKYDADGGQKELKPHRDGSVLSFNIALNDEFEYDGGGTWFASLDDSVKIGKGELVSHASSLLHGGHGITRGKRYIMVCFVILEGYDTWSMRFYNQVRNL